MIRTQEIDHGRHRMSPTPVPALAEVARFRRVLRDGLRPDPDETIDAWADAHLYLPSHASEGGRWRTSRTPFLKELMECLSPNHPCHKVVFMKPVQIGGTQVAVNWIGYTIARSPAAMLLYEPIQDMVKRLTREKLDPVIAATPALKRKVKEARSRDSGNTTFRKEFLGGFLNLIHANSSASARSTSAPRIVLDEVDEYQYDVGDQGHPCDVIEKRAATYPRYKIFELSTPTVADSSRIEPEYLRGSRGRYHVPCPFCGHLQHLQWGQLIFTFDGVHDPARAAYRCAACAELIPEHFKTWMMDTERARWIHEDPGNETIRSFHLNLLYQPYGWAYPWSRLATQWLQANEKLKAGDHRDLKTFLQTILAQTWEEKGEKADESALFLRRERYEAESPAGVLVLTAAVDVQDDRLEAEIDGWGAHEENWSIARRVFPGNPAQPFVWNDLTDWLQTKRLHACGIALRVESVTVDTGGHHTQQAYWYVRRYRGRCYAIKGSNQAGAPLVPPRPTKPRGASVQLYHVGTVAAKDTLFARLKLTEPGPGYIHFPKHQDYDEEYFRQLGAEEKRNIYERGIQRGYHYVKTRARNEALDLKVYNLAAVTLLNPHFEKLTAKQAQYVPQVEIETEAEPMAEPVAVPVGAPELPVEKPAQTNFVKRYNPPRRHSGGFVQGWR